MRNFNYEKIYTKLLTPEIVQLLENALTDRIDDHELFMHSIDASYGYEGYTAFRTKDI